MCDGNDRRRTTISRTTRSFRAAFFYPINFWRRFHNAVLYWYISRVRRQIYTYNAASIGFSISMWLGHIFQITKIVFSKVRSGVRAIASIYIMQIDRSCTTAISWTVDVVFVHFYPINFWRRVCVCMLYRTNCVGWPNLLQELIYCFNHDTHTELNRLTTTVILYIITNQLISSV